jgi:hypothetical protein
MTQRPEPKTPSLDGIAGTGVGMVLNHVSSNVLSGLIETLAAPPYNGHADLPVLAGQLQLEADEILHLGESLQLLRFAQLSEGDLMLTDAGNRFAHLETDARKKLFAEHLLNHVPVAALIRRVLDERPSHSAPAARFRNQLEDYMSEDDADETLRTAVSWGRYAELFAYDEQAEMFSLETPVSPDRRPTGQRSKQLRPPRNIDIPYRPQRSCQIFSPIVQLIRGSFSAAEITRCSGVLPATSSRSFVRIASLNFSRSLIDTTNEPGPPMTQSS